MRGHYQKILASIIPAILFLLPAFYCKGISPSQIEPPPVAFDGLIDLRNWNFEKHGYVELNGIWKFQPNDDNTQFAAVDYNDGKWENIKVPAYWNSITKTGDGYGWYRLHVLVSDNFWGKSPAIYIKGANTSYECYANGIKIFGAGGFGITRATSWPSLLPQFSRRYNGPWRQRVPDDNAH